MHVYVCLVSHCLTDLCVLLWAGESHDRESITLPGVQEEFALKVLDLCKHTALVHIHGKTPTS
mgnify:CR=1 FL=1